MNDQDSRPTKTEIFVQGFFLRLQAGLAAAGVIALCTPRIIVPHHRNFIIATVLYSFICIAGGIRDANTLLIEDRRLFGRITLKRSLLTVLSLLFFAYMIVNMK